MRQRLPFLHFYVDFLNFEAAEPSLASGGLAVVMEEVGVSMVLADAVVGSPPDDGLKELTTETEGTIGAVAYAIAEEVGVACAPGIDVFPVLLMQPRETVESRGASFCSAALFAQRVGMHFSGIGVVPILPLWGLRCLRCLRCFQSLGRQTHPEHRHRQSRHRC